MICVGSSSEKTFMGAKMTTDKQVELMRNAGECIQSLPSILHDGDSILVKASNAMKFPTIVAAIKEMK